MSGGGGVVSGGGGRGQLPSAAGCEPSGQDGAVTIGAEVVPLLSPGDGDVGHVPSASRRAPLGQSSGGGDEKLPPVVFAVDVTFVVDLTTVVE